MSLIAITGGSGFVGQHLIKEIQASSLSLDYKGILNLDRQALTPFFDFEGKLDVTTEKVDLSSRDAVDAVFEKYKGRIAVVFHLASARLPLRLSDLLVDPLKDNLTVTKNILINVRRHEIRYLVHCSDHAIVCDYLDTQAPREVCTMEMRKPLFFGEYARTKFLAEKTILDANGCSINDGPTLHTVSIRPPFLYGEGDSQIFPYALEMCERYGHLPTISSGNALSQFTYVGNAAASLILAFERLQADPSNVGGEAFFITENTYPELYSDFLQPYVQAAGYKVNQGNRVWYEPFLLLVMIFSLLLSLLGKRIAPLLPLHWPTPPITKACAAWWIHYKTAKARNVLGYFPKYEPKEGEQRTVNWIRDKRRTSQPKAA